MYGYERINSFSKDSCLDYTEGKNYILKNETENINADHTRMLYSNDKDTSFSRLT